MHLLGIRVNKPFCMEKTFLNREKLFCMEKRFIDDLSRLII